MLEFIGFLALCFIGYKILKILILKNNQFNSIKNFVEIEDFCINELEIPKNYLNFIMNKHLTDVKKMATEYKNEFPDAKWSELMTISIYSFYYDDLTAGHYILENENINIEYINRDINKYFINSKKSYSNYSNYEIEQLIIMSSEIYYTKIKHHSSIATRIKKYIKEKKYNEDFYNGGMGFSADDIDDKNCYSIFIKPITSEYKKDITPFYIRCGILYEKTEYYPK